LIKAEYFAIHELVPPKTYEARGEKAWQLIDPKLIYLIDALREEFGQATINNYKYGGNRQWSGLRTSDSPYYSAYSQHSFGRAADILFKDHTADEVRKAMVENPDKWLAICPSVTLEDQVTWVHADVRNSYNCITLFNP
jgi:hypothetical protein